MEKNLLFAFISSTIILAVYWYFFPPGEKTPSKPPVAIEAEASPTTDAPQAGVVPLEPSQAENPLAINPAVPAAPTTDNQALASQEIKIDSGNFSLIFDTKAASLKKLYLNNYNYALNSPQVLYKKLWDMLMSNPPPKKYDPKRKVNMIGEAAWQNDKILALSFNPGDENLVYSASEYDQQNNSITFEATSPLGYSITKQFRLKPDDYQLELLISLKNNTDSAIAIYPQLFFGSGNEMIEAYYQPANKVVMSLIDDDYEKYKIKEKFSLEQYQWLAIADTYFVNGLMPSSNDWQADFEPTLELLAGKSYTHPLLTLKQTPRNLLAGAGYEESFKFYAGPKDLTWLEKFEPTFDETLDLFLNIIARPMLLLLRWFNSYVANWGIAIMLLTVVVRIIIFPLAFSGMRAMKNMSKLNPRIQILRKMHAKDKQKLNTEIMQLYRKNKANPVGGCLPLLAQFPIFIALYWALLPAVEIRHQPLFLWLNDLSNYDPFMILPIIMGATMFLQQKISPPPANLEPLQQKMMQFLPLILVVFFVNFPAGLVLYWVTSNVITIFQQLVFNRIKVKEVIE